MKAKVYAENVLTGKKRYLGVCVYDNSARAMEMYADACGEDEEIILIDIKN